MELRHLRYFLAVAEALSFRGAAGQLRVSQPALSKQIRDLEEELGARLLDRTTARVRLTDAGAVLLEESRRLLADANRLAGLVREAARGQRGTLAIGNVGSVSAGFLPASLTAFHLKYPEVEVTLAEMRFREQRAALAAGRIQIGIIGGSAPPEDREFECVQVLRSPFRVFVARRSGLARRAKISIEELAREPLLAVTGDPGPDEHSERVKNVFVVRGVKPPAIKKVDSLESLLALVAANQGVSVLPAFIGAQRGIDMLAKPLKEPGEDQGFSLWGVRRRDETSQLAKNFIAVLQAQTRRS
jgi:DNA-binding transcriptional LysR family regulator